MIRADPWIGVRAAAAVVVMSLLGSCSLGGTSGSGPGLPGSSRQPALSKAPVEVPSGLAQAGSLTVAADPTEAPLVYFDQYNLFAGFSVELLAAIASQMGLKLAVININGADVVPGFTDKQHRYDIGVAAQPATPALAQTAATITYLVGGQAILARRDRSGISGLDSLCGLKVGSNRGTIGETAVKSENEGKCLRKPIVYTAYDDDVKGIQDLRSGQLQAFVEDYAVATAFARLYGDIRLVPHHFNTAPEVFVLPLTATALHDSVAAAFTRVRQQGTYQKLLERWGLTEGAVS